MLYITYISYNLCMSPSQEIDSLASAPVAVKPSSAPVPVLCAQYIINNLICVQFLFNLF
jgi:hypothetical protein